MQIALATPKVQSYTVSQLSQLQERQPQQLKLEASVADSFTPSFVQERSGVNGKVLWLAPLLALNGLVTSCSSGIAKKEAPVVQKTVVAEVAEVAQIVEKQVEKAAPAVEEKIKPELMAKIVEIVDDIQADSSIQPIGFEPPPTPQNEASLADLVDPKGLSKEKKIEIGRGLIQASQCKEGKKGSWLYILDPKLNPIGSYSTDRDCKLGVFKTADTLIKKGRVAMPPDSSVVLKKLIRTADNEGYVLQVNQAPGLTKE